MATETEIKLSLSARAASQLAKHRLLAGSASHRQLLVNTYYDTPDTRLRHERIVVRHRLKGSEWLLTVKTVAVLTGGLAQRGEWEVPGRPGAFDFSHVDNCLLRDLLESIRHELRPIFTTRFTRQSWLLEPRAGVRIELALDRGRIEAQDRRRTICEVELELLAGTVNELFLIASELQATLPLHPEVSSKSDRAYRLLANAPLAAVKAQLVPVEAGMPPIAAFRLIALCCLHHLQCNEEGVCESDLPEFVHQARVAIRRLRSAIGLWKPLLPGSFVACFDPLWQELATKLGDARNWDVFISETLPGLSVVFSDRVVIDRLSDHALRRCINSRRAARRALKSVDYWRLLTDFASAVLGLPESGPGRLEEFVPGCLKKRVKRVNERAPKALAGDAEERHRLRVAFKQLRYALEFFTPILAGSALASYHQSATSLQEVLGRLNDLSVASQMTALVLPGKPGEEVRSWLAGQIESLRPEFATLLGEFQLQAAPWKPS